MKSSHFTIAAFSIAVVAVGGCTSHPTASPANRRPPPIATAQPEASPDPSTPAGSTRPPPTRTPARTTSPSGAITPDAQVISDPASAAAWLYEAWRAKDRARALRFANRQAVDALFIVSRERSLRYSHCNHRLTGYDCIYAFTAPSESPDAIFRVEGGALAGYRVTSVSILEQQRISDPARAAARLYDAWLANDRPRALQAADQATVDTIFAVPRTHPPAPSGCAYRDFGFDCTYTGDYIIVIRVEGGASVGYGVVSIAVRRP